MFQREKHQKKEKIQRQRNKLFNDNYEEQLFNDITVSDDHDQESQEVEPTVNESSFIDEECVHKQCAEIDTYIYVNPSGKLVSDQGSQTIYSKYELSAKVETMILKNDVSTMQLQGPKIVSTLFYENIVQDIALVKHFTGLKPSQFEVLHDFCDDVCRLETMNYWAAILKKPLSQAPKRPQALILWLHRYDVDFHYVEGSKLFITDTPSRAFLDVPDTHVRVIKGNA